MDVSALGIDPSTTANDARYAEALRQAEIIAANETTTASNPGGLSPSIYKIQIVELLSTG